VEQLTYLLFLKMADEPTKAPWNQPSAIPAGYDWPSLMKRDGDDLFDHYRHLLETLGNEKGLLGLIFGKEEGASIILPLNEVCGPGQVERYAVGAGISLSDLPEPRQRHSKFREQ
jgi:hypothetical protein